MSTVIDIGGVDASQEISNFNNQITNRTMSVYSVGPQSVVIVHTQKMSYRVRVLLLLQEKLPSVE